MLDSSDWTPGMMFDTGPGTATRRCSDEPMTLGAARILSGPDQPLIVLYSFLQAGNFMQQHTHTRGTA